MNNKKRLIYLSISIMIILSIILNKFFILNEDVRELIGYILKVPFVYFFCGIFSPDISNKPLLYIGLTVAVLMILNFIGSPFSIIMKELIGYLIGGGILLFVFYVLPIFKSKAREREE